MAKKYGLPFDGNVDSVTARLAADSGMRSVSMCVVPCMVEPEEMMVAADLLEEHGFDSVAEWMRSNLQQPVTPWGAGDATDRWIEGVDSLLRQNMMEQSNG